MLKRLGRLFVIKTRTEAWLVTYAIAVGAVERGHHYLQMYPGFGGWLLAIACTGVVFIAGARLLDSVKRPAPTLTRGPVPVPVGRRSPAVRSRPRHLPLGRHAARRSYQRTD